MSTGKKRRFAALPAALALLLWIPSSITAQETAEATERVCLWEVTAGAGSRLHLVGSLHLMKTDDYPLDSRFESVFSEAGTVVFEADLDSVNADETQAHILAKAIYPDGQTLQSELSEPFYEELADFLGELGIPIQYVNSFKPWFLGLTLTSLELVQLGYDPQLGVDQYFYGRAKEANKSVAGLESAESQIDLMVAIAELDEEAYLQQVIDEYDHLNDQLDEIMSAWKTGDIERLDMLNQGLREYPLIYDAIIVERNKSWLPQIEAYLADGRRALVIVGAAHLPGEHGLIRLLAEKGYRISQY